MRVAAMAAGAVGGYFGARLAAAGHDVAFIARGAHRDAIRRDGLRIESALGDLHLNDINVTDDPQQVGPVDLVLFAVKLWDTETAGEQTRPLLGAHTRVITLQNGVDSVERLAPILGDEHTIGGAGYVGQMKRASIDITLAEDMLLDLWKKFVLLSGTSSITASTRQPLGVIRDDDDMRAFLFKLMHETLAVGRAAGIVFPQGFPAELENAVTGFSPAMKASMANDLEAGN